MGPVTAEVRALLQARRDQRKAELEAHRRDVEFAVGDDSEVLLDTEHTPIPSRSLLPRAGWPLQGTCTPGTQHVSPRDSRDVARLR